MGGAVKGSVMAKPLRVDPVDLQMSADHIAVHCAEFRAAHADTDADIEAAQPGWVGTSASALRANFVEWQAATTQLSSAMEAHGVALRAAAQSYTTTDSGNAVSLDSQF